MSIGTRNIFIAILVASLMTAIFLFYNDIPIVPIDTNKDEINRLDSIVNNKLEELRIKDSLLIISHKKTIENRVKSEQKINTKYVTIVDSIKILPTSSKTEFLRNIYVFK